MTDPSEVLRYGVYLAPGGALGALGASWLGWDVFKGADAAQPTELGVDLPGLTQRPQRYGFHATLKAPFALVKTATETDLRDALAQLAADLCSTQIAALHLRWVGRFLALVSQDDDANIRPIADAVVSGLDRFRAPMGPDELARRSFPGMTDAHRTNLDRWGYARVFDAFQFHMTLTGPVPKSQRVAVERAARAHFSGAIGVALPVTELALVGEGAEGRFRVIETFSLGGPRLARA